MSDPRRLYVHIGLPKTATTSLQRHVFSQNWMKPWCYLGVFQPRDNTQLDVYQQFSKAISCTTERFYDYSDAFINAICQSESGSSFFLSEEMICVDTPGVCWQKKIRRLAELTHPFETRIALTLRQPGPAAFSLYVQIWNDCRHEYPTFGEFLRNSNQARLFDYRQLIELLESSFGRDSITLFEFEHLKNDRDFLTAWERFLEIQIPLRNLPQENKKQANKQHVYTDTFSISQWVRNLSRRSQHDLTKSLIRRGARWFRFLKPWIGQLPLPNSSRPIEKPDWNAVENAWFDSNQWLFDQFGIDYRKSIHAS